MSDIQIEQFVVGPVATNCYFIIQPSTKELLIVDPGASGKRLAQIAKEKDYTPIAILLTHGHFDHVDGIEDFIHFFHDREIPIYAFETEKAILQDPDQNLSESIGEKRTSYHADHFLKDEETITLAGFSIKVLHTPGHTPGGCCFYFPDQKKLFCGDTLFAGSMGRTDFPGGNFHQLIKSIKEKCVPLPDDTTIYPGHEGRSTIGDEKKYNPFCK